jgi:16S rRNA processing protein RimM
MMAGWPHLAERICVGRIGAPHGVRGEVRLQSYTGEPMAIADYGALENKDGTLTLAITSVRPAKNILVARFKGVDDRTAAEKLTNVELYVPRERLPAPDADEFYHADLIGLAAVDAAGTEIGTVVAVHDFGAGDILELRPTGARGTVMLPFTDATVPVVDIAGGRIVIDPPQGLMKE